MARAPQSLRFERMELKATDFEPPIVIGRGEFRCPSPSRFEYTLTGTPEDPTYVLAQIRRQRQDTYDGRLRFRLFLTDEEGRSYNGGWTIPKVREGRTNGKPWIFEGECQGLMTDDPTVAPSQGGANEVEFLIPRHHRASLFLARFVSTDLEDASVVPEHRLEVLDTTVTFRFDAERNVLSISAPAGGALSLPCAENWLGEPLRILFGQLAFPRLVARSFPQGGAMISQRKSPSWSSTSDWAAVWDREDLEERDEFWALYADLLAYIASARDGRGEPNFEANTITSLYHEVIQAARGSRWVWALTFASSVEGLVRLLTPRGTRRPDAHEIGIVAITKHINDWPAVTDRDRHLRGVAISAVNRTAETTPKYILDQLTARGVVSADQVKAWSKIRNSVMHGSLVSPYSSREEDGLLLNLAALMRGLTIEIVRADRQKRLEANTEDLAQSPTTDEAMSGAQL